MMDLELGKNKRSLNSLLMQRYREKKNSLSSNHCPTMEKNLYNLSLIDEYGDTYLELAKNITRAKAKSLQSKYPNAIIEPDF